MNLKFLVCTSTLIEGVNTKAKNVIVYDNKIARRKFDFFTFNNITGRSGRMFVHFIGDVYLFAPPPQEQLPFVDFPVFTQDEDTPDSLLVQLTDDELQPAARSRVQKWREQDLLPVSVLRENSTIDPDVQIEVARQIERGGAVAAEQLGWRRMPDKHQMPVACDLIWQLAQVKQRRGGVSTPRQLAFKIWQLQRIPSVAKRVRQELQPGQYAAESADEAVERVLQFERSWASFEFPKFLMALSRIQRHVLEANGYASGDYSYFASRVECLFLTPVVSALDEYGIPMQVAARLSSILETDDDLDRAIENLRRADLSTVTDDPFELELLEDAQRAM